MNLPVLPPSFVAVEPPPSFALHKAKQALWSFLRSQDDATGIHHETVVLKGSWRRKAGRKASAPQRAWSEDVPKHQAVSVNRKDEDVDALLRQSSKRRCGKQRRRKQGMSADQALREMQKRISSRGGKLSSMVKSAAYFRAFPVMFGHSGVAPS
jgi:hypothetical protein